MNLHRPAKNMVALQNLFFYFTEKNMWGGPAEPWAKTPPPHLGERRGYFHPLVY